MKNKLTILIVNYNAAKFIEVSLFALEKLTKNPFCIFILDNNSSENDVYLLKNIIKNHKNVFLERKKTQFRGSAAHGAALNYLVKKVETPYFVILDADAIFLKKNWDETLISRINSRVKIVGTQAPVGSLKPQDFPLMFGALFETKAFQKLDIDFQPKDVKHYLDTGYEMREKYLNSGLQGEIIEGKTTRNFREGPFRDVLCAEYYFSGDKEIFASHFGRGSSYGLSKYMSKKNSWIFRIPVFGYFLARFRGGFEKNKWIKICRRIIDNQL